MLSVLISNFERFHDWTEQSCEFFTIFLFLYLQAKYRGSRNYFEVIILLICLKISPLHVQCTSLVTFLLFKNQGPRCCGSRLDVKQMVASPQFRRFCSGGSFFVNYTISPDVGKISTLFLFDHQMAITQNSARFVFSTSTFFPLQRMLEGFDV